MSVPATEIKRLASKRDASATYLIGIRNDRTAIPVLRQLAASPVPPETENHLVDRYRKSSLAAKAALTRMGAHDYFDEFVIELSTSNPTWKQEVIEALGYTGDKRAIKYLGRLLEDDTAVPIGGHGLVQYHYQVAAEALGEILQPPFMDIVKNEPAMPRTFSKEWKQWWKDNKAKYK